MRARRLWLTAALAACATTPPPDGSIPTGPLRVTARPVQVQPDTRRPLPLELDGLSLVAALELSSEHPRFGGLSGLELTADGKTLVLLSDRGHWLRARLRQARDGRLLGLDDWHIAPIRDAEGHPVLAPRHDAEGLARAPDGAWLVSFEWNHRIWRYPEGLAQGRPAALRLPREVAGAPGNGSLEALAVLPDGRVLVICEHFLDRNGRNRGWLGQDGALQPLTYRTADPDFAPTDLAVVPGTGDVLVLERAFSLLKGNRARICRIRARDLVPGTSITPEPLANLGPPLVVDNFEGLAAQRHGTGAILLYVVSDSNFNPLQRTLLYQLRLDR